MVQIGICREGKSAVRTEYWMELDMFVILFHVEKIPITIDATINSTKKFPLFALSINAIVSF